MEDKLKSNETIGCCGIDCGLCPRFYTKGDSACPGCGGLGFREKHPSCGVLSCCVIKNGLEVCSDCGVYPCSRYESAKVKKDSFVSHKKMFANLDCIREYGIDHFINRQKTRIEILNKLLISYNEGRSKNFYCIACALLPVDKLEEIRKFADNLHENTELIEKSKLIKKALGEIAASMKIELKLDK